MIQPKYTLPFHVKRSLLRNIKSKETIQFSEKDFTLFFNEAPIGMLMTTPDGYFFRVNEAFCDLIGYTQKELMGKTIFDITHQDDLPTTKDIFKEVQAGERYKVGVEKRYIRKTGEVVWVRVMATWFLDNNRKPLYSVGLIQNITEEKKNEFINSSFFERNQKQQSVIVKLATNNAVYNSNFETAINIITEASANTLDVERVGIWLLNKDKQQLQCLDLYERASKKHSSGMILSAQQYPDYFKSIVTGRAVDAVDAQTDPRTREFAESYLKPFGITSMLDAAIRVSGDIVGIICHEHVGPIRHWLSDETTFAGEIADQVAQVMLNNERKKVLNDLHEANCALEKRVEERTKALREEMAERKRSEQKEKELQAQLLQAEKLSSIGLLSAGIAHELNNPLTGLLSLLRTYRKRKDEGSEDYRDLTEMLEASDHMAQIIEDLNSFSRVSEGKMDPLNINKDIIKSTLSFTIPRTSENKIIIKQELTEGLPYIRGNKQQLQQVLVNLLTNAYDAMPEGGILTIKTSLTADKNFVNLSVSDTGTGISKTFLSKIFDPFFTTKMVGKGTGLGLSVLHGIIQYHGGEIAVQSKEGIGTCFSIILPTYDSCVKKTGNIRILSLQESEVC